MIFAHSMMYLSLILLNHQFAIKLSISSMLFLTVYLTHSSGYWSWNHQKDTDKGGIAEAEVKTPNKYEKFSGECIKLFISDGINVISRNNYGQTMLFKDSAHSLISTRIGVSA